MKPKGRIWSGVAAAFLFASPQTAQAQQLMNFITRTTIPIVIQCPGCNKARAQPDLPENIPTIRPGPNVAANPSVLRFVPSLPLRRKMEADLAAIGTRADPIGALTSLLTQTPPIAAMHQRMTSAGLDPNDFGSAVAMFLGTQWALANGTTKLPTRAQKIGIKKQFSPALSAQPAFKSASHVQKQEAAEGFLLEAHFFMVLMTASGGNVRSVARLSAAAEQKMRSFGIDPGNMTLTAKGFSLR